MTRFEWLCLDGRIIRAALFAAIAWFSIPAGVARSQSSDFDDWQGFKPGSWCELRTTVEAMDPQGATVASKSTAIALTTLEVATKDSITLSVAEGTIEYAGKHFPTPAATLVLRPYGRRENEQISLAEQPKVEIELGGEKFECRRMKAQLTGENGTREVLTVFRDAAVHSPLRRVAKVFDAQGSVTNTTTTEAVSFDGAVRVNEGMLRTVHYRVLYRNHKLSSTALVDKTADVPGQVVRSTIVEREPDGRLVRHITQELVDYAVATDAVPGTEIGDRPRDRREERRDDRREERRNRRTP